MTIRHQLGILLAAALIYAAPAVAQTIKIGVLNTHSGPFATLGDTSLEDFFGEQFARKIHLCLAAALAAFGALLAGGALGR